jgi:twitching motility protein PilT
MDDPQDFIEQALRFAVASHASDLHLADGKRPRLRIDGVLRLINLPPLIDGDVEGCLDALMNDAQREQWKAFRRCELMHTIAKLARFRIRMFTQHQGAGAVIRVLPHDVPKLDTSGPPSGFSAVSSGAGIVFVTGPAGCGRTTVLASMLLAIDRSGPNRMVSIGRPLEFDLSDRLRDLTQVDLTHSAGGYPDAIREASAAGAKVIAVDDASDPATMIEALRAAKQGCLVLCGLRAANTRYAIYEIIRRCPEGEEIARQLLADTFLAAFAQRWIRTVGGGRMLAFEVLLGIPSVRNLLKGITTSSPLYSLIQTHTHFGFQTFEQNVHRLLQEQRISVAEAASHHANPEAFAGHSDDNRRYPSEDCDVVPAISPGMYAPEALEDPEVFERVARCREGLIVISGPPASGRTGTAAYLLSLMMAQWQRHLVTLECPGEQAFEARIDTRGHVTRHEVRAGEADLTDVVTAALGEDPDVLFVAVELDTAALMLLMDAANSGALVVIVLPARSAAGAIEYLRSRMPAGEWPDRFENRRLMIRAAFAQRLVPRVGGGRVAAYEIKLERQTGMQTFAQHLSRLAEARIVSAEDARLDETPEPSNALDIALHL